MSGAHTTKTSHKRPENAVTARVPAPFTIDSVVAFLDRSAFSPFGASLLYLALARKPELFSPRLARLVRFVTGFTALKTVHRALERLIVNNGWRRDRPRWDRDVVLITGGAGGIGGELVDILARRTNRVCVLDLCDPLYQARNVHFYKCDITNPQSIKEVGDQIRREVGEPTIIVNNAGIARGRRILDLTSEQFLQTYKVNTLGCFNILKEFLPHIVKHNHGHIMTTASSASYMSIAQLSEYACSKSAALALHEVLTQELKHRYNAPRVRTSIICPTKVNTQMGDGMDAPPAAMKFFTPVLEAWQVAERMAQIIESGLSDHAVMPLYASILLPSIRAMPGYWREYVHKRGNTSQTVTDTTSERASSKLRRPDGYESP